MERGVSVVRPDPGGVHVEMREEFEFSENQDVTVRLKGFPPVKKTELTLQAKRVEVSPSRGELVVVNEGSRPPWLPYE